MHVDSIRERYILLQTATVYVHSIRPATVHVDSIRERYILLQTATVYVHSIRTATVHVDSIRERYILLQTATVYVHSIRYRYSVFRLYQRVLHTATDRYSVCGLY